MDRLASPRIQDGDHLLRVIRYGDLNPVRAKQAKTPDEWQWSSFRHYAYGEPNDLITDAPEYLALGRTNVERRKAYLHLFAMSLADELLTRRRDLVCAAFIGDDAWIAKQLRAKGLSPPD